jgi:hypothetical protein
MISIEIEYETILNNNKKKKLVSNEGPKSSEVFNESSVGFSVKSET